MQPVNAYAELQTFNGGLGFAVVLSLAGIDEVKKQIVKGLDDADASLSDILPLVKQILPVSRLHVFDRFTTKDKLRNLTSIFLTMIRAIITDELGSRKYSDDNIHELIQMIVEKNIDPSVALAHIHTKMDKRGCSVL